MEVLPVGIVLCEEHITRTLIKAVRFYAGFACLENAEVDNDTIHSLLSDTNEIEEECLNVNLTLSEEAIIRPLFDLYVELENANTLESSRSQGLEVYGRSVSEIQPDVTLYENEMHKKAFIEPFFTV